MIKSDH